MLALTNTSLRRGRKVLFESASFQIHAGQRMGVIGANGCGKSSLFALLLGELEPDEGELALDPKDQIAHVAQESPHGSGSAVGYVMDGDHEFWYSPITNRCFSVDHKIVSRHSANTVLKQAGLAKQF